MINFRTESLPVSFHKETVKKIERKKSELKSSSNQDSKSSGRRCNLLVA